MKKYVVLNLKGGLGNQIFQLLAAYSFLHRNKINKFYIYTGNLKLFSTPRKFELESILKSPDFDIQVLHPFWFVLFNKYLLIVFLKFKLFIINENNFNKKATFFQIIDGYFQHKNYIEDFSLSVIKKSLSSQLEPFISTKFSNLKNIILDTKVVGFHIRLGDRYTDDRITQIKCVLNNFDFSVYDNVFLFTDQPQSLSNLKEHISTNIIEVHLFSLTDFEEFMLCSFLREFIVSNSTFSILSRVLSSNNTITYYNELDFLDHGLFLPDLMKKHILLKKIPI